MPKVKIEIDGDAQVTVKKGKSKAPKGALTIHMVLDRSGSMGIVRDATIAAFNEYVSSIAAKNKDSTVSLTLFDHWGSSTQLETVFDNVPVKEVPPLTRENYTPRGGTPLFDAIGACVTELSEKAGKQKVLVVLTDGQENSSTEFSDKAIKKLLKEKQDKENWLVIYLGANQDAIKVGATFGTRASNTMTYNVGNMSETLQAVGAASLRYAATNSLDTAAFTSTERKRAAGQKVDWKDLQDEKAEQN